MRSGFGRGAPAAAALALLAVVAPGAARAGTPVVFAEPYAAGTIVVLQRERALYFVTGAGRAIRYPVAVGRAGKTWSGRTQVVAKFRRPSWSPPPDVRADHPGMARFIPGGSPRNPMGAAAIVLGRDDLAIHGTTKAMRASIGSAASYGCIRMYDEDVLDLFGRVAVGTPVVAPP